MLSERADAVRREKLTCEQCANCRKEMVSSNLKQLETHAETHDQKLWSKEKCWPDIFKVDA